MKIQSENYELVHAHIKKIMGLVCHSPSGFLCREYLSVTHGQHYPGIFVWDCHHMAMRYAYDGKPQYLRNLVDIVLAYQQSDGFVPNCVSAEDGPLHYSPKFHAQPFLMQAAVIYVSATNDIEWLKSVLGKLEKYLSYYNNNYCSPYRLYHWPECFFSGFDNEVISFFRPGTLISPDISSWMYLEHDSASRAAGLLGDAAKQEHYSSCAKAIADAVNDKLWNERVGSYCSYDLVNGRHVFAYEDAGLEGAIGRYAYQTCSNLIPLYAKISPQQQASEMMEKYVLSPEHFWSDYGICSLSRSSEYFNNAVWGNPGRFSHHSRLTSSNWQGPVWVPLCYFMFEALKHYGYQDKANELAVNTVNMLAGSLKTIGSFTENFCSQTGKPLYAENFASWNIRKRSVKPFEGAGLGLSCFEF